MPPVELAASVPSGTGGPARNGRTARDPYSAARLAEQLTAAGGLGMAFASFLQFRADLLEPEFLDALRPVRECVDPLDAGQRAAAMLAAFGSRGAALLEVLDPRPVWSTVSRCAYLAVWQGKRVVVQVARQPVDDAAFEEFERVAADICTGRAAKAGTPEVFQQFRRWVRLADDPGRERSYLEAVAGLREQTSIEYPLPIPELSAGRVLSWEWREGSTLENLLAALDKNAAETLAEVVLEQICLLSLVDADIDLSNIVLTGDRVVVRRANRLEAIPPPRVRIALRYVSAVVSLNSPVALRALLKLAWGRVAIEQESKMLDELSGLGPELKGGRQFTPAATMIESNWRALSRINGSRPLFLDSLHRNLISVSYRNAETSPDTDCLIAAQWPVAGRLLRLRASGLLDQQAASEWIVGSGLLMFESLRQVNRLADEFRDNEVAIGVDQAPQADGHHLEANRSAGVWILIGVFFVMFLISLRWAAVLPAPYSTAGTVLAIVGALGMFRMVSKVG